MQVLHKKTRRQTGAAFALAAVVLLSSSGALAAVCIRPSEAPALETRMIQTELMVAALTCDQRTGYNNFITKFKGDLIARGKSLRSLFQRLYGNVAESKLNTFVTRIANETSLRSIQTDGYCQSTAELFADLRAVSPGGLAAFAAAQPSSDKHGLPVCTELSENP